MPATRRSTAVWSARAGTTAAKDATIKAIATLMASGQWTNVYRSTCDYAAATGLAEATVAEYAKEAARLLRIFWSDDTARIATLERIRQLGEDAANRCEDALDRDGNVVSLRKPDYKSAITAANSVAAILGMQRPVDVRVSYERMSDDQLLNAALDFLKSKKTAELSAPITVEMTDDNGSTDACETIEVHEPESAERAAER